MRFHASKKRQMVSLLVALLAFNASDLRAVDAAEGITLYEGFYQIAGGEETYQDKEGNEQSVERAARSVPYTIRKIDRGRYKLVPRLMAQEIDAATKEKYLAQRLPRYSLQELVEIKKHPDAKALIAFGWPLVAGATEHSGFVQENGVLLSPFYVGTAASALLCLSPDYTVTNNDYFEINVASSGPPEAVGTDFFKFSGNEREEFDGYLSDCGSVAQVGPRILEFDTDEALEDNTRIGIHKWELGQEPTKDANWSILSSDVEKKHYYVTQFRADIHLYDIARFLQNDEIFGSDCAGQPSDVKSCTAWALLLSGMQYSGMIAGDKSAGSTENVISAYFTVEER